MIDLTIPALRLYDEADRDNNSITREYAGDRKMKIGHIEVHGMSPREHSTARPWAVAVFTPHGLYHVEKGAIAEDPVLCFKKAMLYALKMQWGSMMGDGENEKKRWQEEVLPAIAVLEKDLNPTEPTK